jgi:ketosteroid isomerase-like protein
MNLDLPPILQKYVEASNRHDVKTILACFSDNAVVRDEVREFRGQRMIEDWIVKTIEKYKFQFEPVSVSGKEPEFVVAIEVSGTFPGSPVTPDYRFLVENDNILSLTID